MYSEAARKKIEKFQSEIAAWAARSKDNPVVKKMLHDFFLDPTKVKLAKTKEELPLLEFSFHRLKCRDRDVFRIVSHEELGRPGAFGRVKLAFPVSVLPDRIEIKQHIPIALKIIRHQQMDDRRAPIFSLHAKAFIEQDSYGKLDDPDIFGVAVRPTTSTKSRYDKHQHYFQKEVLTKSKTAEMDSKEKKEISMRFADGIELEELLKTQSSRSTFQQILPEDTILKIVLGLIRELLELHNANYAHLDVHPGNILLDTNYYVSLIDPDCITAFGFSISLRSSPPFRLPGAAEIRVSAQPDVFAFGVILRKLLLYCPAGIMRFLLMEWITTIDRTKGTYKNALYEIQKALMALRPDFQLPPAPTLGSENILQIPLV